MGELKGVQVNPREIAKLAYDAGITDTLELLRSVAICLAESQGFDLSTNDNFKLELDGSKTLLSRDVGMWQINIPASQVGTSVEANLYDRQANAKAMVKKYLDRGWLPWVAYTTGVYLHDSYMSRAIRGVGNFLGEHFINEMKSNNVPTNMIIPTLYFQTYPKRYSYAPFK